MPEMIALPVDIPNVPFHSQLQEIQSTTWQQQGCGITSLAMVIDYYTSDPVSVETLLTQGIAAGAYIQNAGWSYKGLIDVSKKYGLKGNSFDFKTENSKTALASLTSLLKDGPVIASIYYKFDPKNPLPHMVVIEGIENNIVYYNDPATRTGGKQISITDFLTGWKKRGIVIRPVVATALSMDTAAETPLFSLYLRYILQDLRSGSLPASTPPLS